MGLFSNECAACGSKEHSTSDCPHGLLSSKCASCGSKDHATKDCPHGFLSSKCASCGSKEHSTSDCPHGLLSSKCASCGSKDHATKDCPHGILGSRTFKKHQDKSYSSKEEESGGISEFFGKMIGYIIVGAIILGLIVWLALYIVLPISLLNSALVLTVIGFFIKKHRKLFSILALVGGSYMLLDVLSGWLSVLFIENIVKDNIWISVFVYINSIAIGFSVWVLVQPIWLRTMQMDASKKRKSILLKGVLILLVAIATAVAPVIYHSVQNPFNQKANNNQTSTPSQSNTQNNNDSSSESETRLLKNHYIIDSYIGTIGKKEFKLFIEKVEGENVEGYNVTGSNRRPIKGKIVNKWTEQTDLGVYYTVFKLILTEPGDDKWDGEFNIDLWVSKIAKNGKGNWKSYNGKLERQIIFKKM